MEPTKTEVRYTVVWATCPSCYSERTQAVVNKDEELGRSSLKVWCEDCDSANVTVGREVAEDE